MAIPTVVRCGSHTCPRRPGVGALLLLTVALLLTAGCGREKKETATPKPPVPVTVASSVLKTVPVQIKAIGTIEPFNAVAIKAQVNGQIARVHFGEGQDVRKGDLLFTIDPRPFEAALKQAEATLAKDQAQATFAREQARRYGELLKDGIVTQDQYDQLRANADAYAAAIAADRALVENARIQLGYCYIRSPIDGRTGNLAVKVGNLVKANDLPVLVTINQISPIYATFSIPEQELPELRKHISGGRLKVEAHIPNDPVGPEIGTFSFLDNAVDNTTGTIKLKGTFANREHRLWPGQFVNVALTLASRPDAVVIPTRAVQTGQDGQFVFVVKPDHTVESRTVSVGLALGDESVIDRGVKPGERVVTDGQLRLTPGAKVDVKSTADAPAQGTAGSGAPASGVGK